MRDWFVSIRMRFKVGQTPRASYPLNARVVEDISLLEQREITKEELIKTFTDSLGMTHNEVEIWIKDVELESFYYKFEEQQLCINQIIFDIYIIDKEEENYCHYEHIFFMQDDEEW